MNTEDAEIAQAAIQDERVMVDGRPAFAWWNELQRLRMEAREAKELSGQCQALMRVLKVATVVWDTDPRFGDIHIKVSQKDLMLMDDPVRDIEKAMQIINQKGDKKYDLQTRSLVQKRQASHHRD